MLRQILDQGAIFSGIGKENIRLPKGCLDRQDSKDLLDAVGLPVRPDYHVDSKFLRACDGAVIHHDGLIAQCAERPRVSPHFGPHLHFLLVGQLRHGFEVAQDAIAEHAKIEVRVCPFRKDVERARMVVGSDEGFRIVAALRPKQDAILPDDFAAVDLRDVAELLHNKRRQNVARQEALEIELKAYRAIGLEVMRGLLGRKKRRDHKPIRSEPVGDAESDHGVGDDVAAVRRIAKGVAIRDGGIRLS